MNDWWNYVIGALALGVFVYWIIHMLKVFLDQGNYTVAPKTPSDETELELAHKDTAENTAPPRRTE